MTCGLSIGEGCLDEGYRGWEKIIETCGGVKDAFHLVHTLYSITLVASTLQIINYI